MLRYVMLAWLGVLVSLVILVCELLLNNTVLSGVILCVTVKVVDANASKRGGGLSFCNRIAICKSAIASSNRCRSRLAVPRNENECA
jgi:hypothetical protein